MYMCGCEWVYVTVLCIPERCVCTCGPCLLSVCVAAACTYYSTAGNGIDS